MADSNANGSKLLYVGLRSPWRKINEMCFMIRQMCTQLREVFDDFKKHLVAWTDLMGVLEDIVRESIELVIRDRTDRRVLLDLLEHFVSKD